MEIKIRWISKDYAYVSVSVNSINLDAGVLDKKEREELAEKLRGIADELDDNTNKGE